MRWPEGFTCPRCGKRKHSYSGARRVFQCSSCRKQTTVKSGTIFYKSRTPLVKWFLAIYLLTQSKNDIAALELARQLSVKWDTAWLIKQKLMETMRQRNQVYKLEGEVQIDDAYLGGERPGKPGREPLSLAETQALAAADQALVLFSSNTEALFLWVVTKDTMRWIRVPLNEEEVAARVSALRCGVDPGAMDDSDRWLVSSPADKQRQIAQHQRRADCMKLLGTRFVPDNLRTPFPFDLGRAHDLYRALFGQVEDLIKDKRLLVVPSGAFTALPLQVLVTEKVVDPMPKTWEGYRGVKWFGRQHAITVLPAVASLAGLSKNAKPSRAREAFIGFGDPVLEGNRACPTGKDVDDVSMIGSRAPRNALSAYFRGGMANLAAIRELCPLPHSGKELRAVATSLGTTDDKVLAGSRATETAVKALSRDGTLAQHRIVQFATHGLLAGELEKQTEPALVLTPPAVATDVDDGLLTASEVTQLKLDADWVVLSACNTAAGNKPGAEALSGLARAFFYAGARTLVVSHWPVYSDAAVVLTTSTFAEMRKDAGLDPGEALRRSMLTLIEDSSRERNAHPAMWAPFVIVGGAR
jgi:CHAT domain-containing protein/transposase-like protein